MSMLQNSPASHGGRPSKWTSERAALIEEFHGRRLLSKRAAAQVAGIGLQTLMDWQRRRPNWRDALDALHYRTKAAEGQAWFKRWREEREARWAAALKPKKRKRSGVTKVMRLVCWRLIRFVPPGRQITEEDERTACANYRLPFEQWQRAKKEFPRLMNYVSAKREH